MNTEPSDPSEDYQYHRTHTPESPRPIYPPEPSNIPVLKNQNDPAFTDSSNYADIRPSSQLHAVERNYIALTQNNIMGEGMETGAASSIGDLQGQVHNGSNSNQHVQAYPTQSIPEQDTLQSTFDFLSNPQTSAYAQPEYQLTQTLETLARTQRTATPSQMTQTPSGIANPDIQAQPSVDLTQRSGATNFEPPSETQQQPSHSDAPQEASNVDDGVNYQSLLDTLTRSTAARPATGSFAAQTNTTSTPEHAFPQDIDRSLPSAAGLPPRPPPQEKPAIHPNYSPNDSIRSYHQINAQNASSSPYQNSTGGLAPPGGLPAMIPAGNAPGTFQAPNSLPPPPLATFQHASSSTMYPQSPQAMQQRGGGVKSPAQEGSTVGSEDGDHKWGPEVQRKYDGFLDAERAYVTEGVWDRFPPGSRMFVGNLPTEKVTKRDLFHIFHKHGKLAQISIKQAYGFVQFLEATDCSRALELEQGVSIRGRRLHLEISKPQKNTRNAGQADTARQGGRKRSKSPGRRVAGRRGQDRNQDTKVPFSDFRDEPARRRDDYRPPRSPEAIDYRRQDEYRSRGGMQYYRGSERSRSPYGRSGGRYRSPSPRDRDYDEEVDLALPRRHPTEVPDIQIIVLDDVDPNFIYYLENGFRSKGLQCQTMNLNPRLPLPALVKRQIIEGVQAIIKLTRSSQYNNKVPLQVFDRSGGAEVRFNEYVDLDVNIAAEVVLQNKRNQRFSGPSAPPAGQPYGAQPSQQAYGQPDSMPPQISQGGDANVAGMISNLDGPSLQKLLGALQQQPQNPPIATPVNTGRTPDLASLLTNVARQQQQQQQQPGLHAQGQSAAQYGRDSRSYGNGGPQIGNGQQSQTPLQGQDMQNIMSQLARYQQR